jgi:hypothetical protein
MTAAFLLCAEIIARSHDPGSIKGPLADAIRDACAAAAPPSSPLVGKVADIVLQATFAQRTADVRLRQEEGDT